MYVFVAIYLCELNFFLLQSESGFRMKLYYYRGVCMSSPSGWPSHLNNNNTLKTNEENSKAQTENDVITTTTTTTSDMSLTYTPVAAAPCSASQTSHAAVEQTIVEEYMVSIPLVRPKPAFLKLLHRIGAHGEIFTMKELCYFLKEYIKAKTLYDLNDPSIVYCQNDELGHVFQVDTFTINDVIALLTKHCTYVPDRCLKRRRRILSPASQHLHQQRLYAAQNNDVGVARVLSFLPIIPVNVRAASPIIPVNSSLKNSISPVISSTSPPEASVSGYRSRITPVSAVSSGIVQAVRTNPVSSLGLTTGPIYSPASRTAVSGQVSRTGPVPAQILRTTPITTQALKSDTVAAQVLITVPVAVPKAPSLSTVSPGVSPASRSSAASSQVVKTTPVQDIALQRLASQPQCSQNESFENTQQGVNKNSSPEALSTAERCSQMASRKSSERVRGSRGRKHLRNKSSSESSDAVAAQPKRPRHSHTSISESSDAVAAQPKRPRHSHTSMSESSDAVAAQPKRPRRSHASFSDGAPPGAEEYPWYFRGNREASDESEVLSIQSKETALGRKDSSDDLWFLQEEQGPSDTFSVEYEVQSEDDSPGIRANFGDSDASDTSQEDLVVICHDSDMDFWADADSSTDSDAELTVADNWSCDECDNVNPPLQRYCSRCWKLRSSWLPDKQQATISRDSKADTPHWFTDTAKKPSSSLSSSPSSATPHWFTDTVKKPSSSLSSSPSSASASQPKFASSPKSRKSTSSRRTHFSHHAPSVSLSEDLAARSQPLSSMEEKENKNILSYDSAFQYDSGLGTLSSSQGSHGSLLSQRSSSHLNASSPITSSPYTFVTSSNHNTPVVKRDSLNTVPVISSCLTDKKHSSHCKLESNILESRTTLSNFQVNIPSSVCAGYDEVDGEPGKPDNEPRNDEGEAGPSGLRVTTAPLSKPHSSQFSDQFKVLCMICMSKPKNACLIHGKTSHQVCCYSCAKILKKRGKVCPVCRLPIWHVTKNYMV